MNVNISIRQLQAFILVAKYQSFTRAAESLFISQAGLSAMIKELEDQVGVRLLNRTTRTVYLTDAGAKFHTSCTLVLSEIELGLKKTKETSLIEHSTLNIALTPLVAYTIFPVAYKEFIKSKYNVKVNINDVPQEKILHLIEQNEVNIGFSIYCKPSSRIKMKKIHDFSLLYFVPKNSMNISNLTKVSDKHFELDWDKIPNLPLITLPDELSIQHTINQKVKKLDRLFDYHSTCNNMHTILAMVEAGNGATFLPSLVIPLCKNKEIDIIKINGLELNFPYYIIWKAGKYLPDYIDIFMNSMKKVIREKCTLPN